MFLKLFNILIFLFFIHIANGQQFFKGHLILGFNAAQLDGDDLAGYNMVSLNGGLKVSYKVGDKMNANMEMLYSQRGSRSKISGTNPIDLTKISLRYFEIPVYVSIHDWYQESDKFFKTSAHGGLSYGYLFDVDSNFGLDTNTFRKNDLALLLGVSYSFTKRITLTGRYTTSLFKVYRSAIFATETLRSYFLTFRLEYNL